MAIDLNLIGDLSIYQGENFESLTLHYPEDLSTWLPRGQIRKNYLYKQGSLLANFSFKPIIWAEVLVEENLSFRTIVIPTLSHLITASLPIPKPRGDSNFKPGSNCWVYDIELIKPDLSSSIKLVRGYVEVIPEVTNNV